MVIKSPIRQLSSAERQANRCESDSPFFARRGFSLIELLIVLAILTVATAFVLPAMTGPLDRSRLRSGAVDVQNAWGKARTFAIREGMEMAFRCEIGGQRWKIERASQPESIGTHPDEFQLDIAAEETTQQSTMMREGRLADGIVFDDLKFRSQYAPVESALNSDGSELGLLHEKVLRKWSEPLLFQPDGRSHDARLRITGADGFVVHVKMRGLTAGVSFTPPFRSKRGTQETEERL